MFLGLHDLMIHFTHFCTWRIKEEGVTWSKLLGFEWVDKSKVPIQIIGCFLQYFHIFFCYREINVQFVGNTGVSIEYRTFKTNF